MFLVVFVCCFLFCVSELLLVCFGFVVLVSFFCATPHEFGRFVWFYMCLELLSENVMACMKLNRHDQIFLFESWVKLVIASFQRGRDKV